MSQEITVIGAAERGAIRTVVAFSEEYGNWVRTDSDGFAVIPGQVRPRYTCMLPLDEPLFQCVFCFTAFEGNVYRHLTIKILRAGVTPGFVVPARIATEFGFTGWSGDDEVPHSWAADVDDSLQSLSLLQFVKKDPS